MTFVQLVMFHADDVAPLVAAEEAWLAATAGRRTLQRAVLYRDLHDPGRYVAYNAFADRDAAAVNSALPETDALAGRLAATFGQPTFTDLESIGEPWDASTELADRFRAFMETSGAVNVDILAEDVEGTAWFPHRVGRFPGAAALVAALREEAPSRSFDRYDRQPTRDGFLVHYAYRTQATGDQPSYLSVGLIAATVGGGVVTEVTITCAGSWDAQREAEILDRTAAVVS